MGGHFSPLHLKYIEVSNHFAGSLVRDKTFTALATVVRCFLRCFNNA